MHFDAVVGETVTLSADVPEHPVEQGSNVADHITPEVDRLRLDVLVSNTPIADVANRGATVQSLPTGIGVDVNVLVFPQQFDAVKDTVRDLERFRDEGILIDVVTHARYCASMVVTQIESKPRGTSADITIQFKQVRIVSTRTVALAPKPKEARGQPMKSTGSQQPKPKQSLAVGIFKTLGLVE